MLPFKMEILEPLLINSGSRISILSGSINVGAQLTLGRQDILRKNVCMKNYYNVLLKLRCVS